MVDWIQGWTGFLVICIVALFAHETWRWAGLYLGNKIDLQSELFQWVKAVSTALVAALVMRLLLFPPQGLGELSVEARLIGMVVAVCVFWLNKGGVALAVFLGAMAMLASGLVLQ